MPWDLYWVAKNSSYLLISLTECAQTGFQRPLHLNLSLYSLSKGQQCPLTLVCKASHLRPFNTLTLEWGQLSREVLLWIKSSPLIYLYQSHLYQRKQIWHWSANEKLNVLISSQQCFSLSLPVDLFFFIHLAAVIFKEVRNFGTFWLLRHSELNWVYLEEKTVWWDDNFLHKGGWNHLLVGQSSHSCYPNPRINSFLIISFHLFCYHINFIFLCLFVTSPQLVLTAADSCDSEA